MGRVIVVQELKDVVVTAAIDQDIWSILSGPKQRIQLVSFQLTSNAVSADNISLNLRKIQALGSVGTVPTTMEKLNNVSLSIGSTVHLVDTTMSASTDGGLFGWQWDQLGPVGMDFVPDIMQPDAPPSEGFALTWNTGTGATVSGWVCWEEYAHDPDYI